MLVNVVLAVFMLQESFNLPTLAVFMLAALKGGAEPVPLNTTYTYKIAF